jgi:rhamnose transport system ATP-binding protein
MENKDKPMSEVILKLENITKTFPGVKALDGVHFELRSGEIHALMGENGAGKSTFIKTITGVHMPDSGSIELFGQQRHFSTPREALELGIAAIYQHVTCYPDLSVAENIFIGHEQTWKISGKIDWKHMYSAAQELLDQLNANFSARTRMGDLSVARQQIVEIAKALSMKAKVIIMDEPTAALTHHEANELYRITEKLKADGASIIFISHRLEDIYRLADRVTVFRDATYIGTWDLDELDENKIVTAMVGRSLSQMFPKRKIVVGKEILRVENLSRTGYFRDVSFTVHEGEILALTGLVGAGRTEVCESLFGLASADSGSIYVSGQELTITDPPTAIAHGIGYLPEDRQKQGLILEFAIARNITLPVLDSFATNHLLRQKDEHKVAADLAGKLAVKARDIFVPASTLSGGNQQKVVFAKLMTQDLKVIILDEPTKGVDIGAKAAIYEIIGDMAEKGYGVIFVSSEMPEVLGLSDRIVVMREGRSVATMTTAEASQEDILHAAMGTETHATAQAGGAEK